MKELKAVRDEVFVVQSIFNSAVSESPKLDK